MNIAGSVILTGTSIAPLLLVYASLALLECEYIAAAILVALGVGFFALWCFLMRHAKRNLERVTISCSSLEAVDRSSVGVLILYLLPLLRTSFSDLELQIVIPGVVIFLALALAGYGFHFNPLLNLFRWHFYKVYTDEGIYYILITKLLRNSLGVRPTNSLSDS